MGRTHFDEAALENRRAYIEAFVRGIAEQADAAIIRGGRDLERALQKVDDGIRILGELQNVSMVIVGSDTAERALGKLDEVHAPQKLGIVQDATPSMSRSTEPRLILTKGIFSKSYTGPQRPVSTTPAEASSSPSASPASPASPVPHPCASPSSSRRTNGSSTPTWSTTDSTSSMSVSPVPTPSSLSDDDEDQSMTPKKRTSGEGLEEHVPHASRHAHMASASSTDSSIVNFPLAQAFAALPPISCDYPSVSRQPSLQSYSSCEDFGSSPGSPVSTKSFFSSGSGVSFQSHSSGSTDLTTVPGTPIFSQEDQMILSQLPAQAIGLPLYGGSSRSYLRPRPFRIPDRSKPFRNQQPAAICNHHYLLDDGCRTPTCPYSHDYLLTPEDLARLAMDSLRSPCPRMLKGRTCFRGRACKSGHACPYGPVHLCPYGQQCKFLAMPGGGHNGIILLTANSLPKAKTAILPPQLPPYEQTFLPTYVAQQAPLPSPHPTLRRQISDEGYASFVPEPINTGLIYQQGPAVPAFHYDPFNKYATSPVEGGMTMPLSPIGTPTPTVFPTVPSPNGWKRGSRGSRAGAAGRGRAIANAAVRQLPLDD